MAGYPNAKFRYKVEIDGIEAGGFTEVTGSDISIEAIEYREGDMTAETPMKVPGLKKYGNLTLKQGDVRLARRRDPGRCGAQDTDHHAAERHPGAGCVLAGH